MTKKPYIALDSPQEFRPVAEYFGREVFLKDTSDFYLECIMEEIGEGWNKVNVEKSWKYQNTFFTAKACQEHIDANRYHYSKPTVYLNHAWRNPEMELVSEFLCSLSGGKLHR